MKALLLTLLSISFLWLGTAAADVTIQFFFGDLPVSNDTVGILVADVSDNGFADLTDAEGTVLSGGSLLGESDDKILAVIQADNGAYWNGAVGFAETISEIDYAELGISENTPLTFYWLPDHLAPGGSLAKGDTWHCFRTDGIGNSGGTIGFTTPADSGSYSIAQLSTTLGGDFNPAAPGNSGTYASGMVGRLLTAPTNFTATNGTLPDKVSLSWDTLAGADGYKVFRNTVNDFATATEIAQPTANSYDDSSAIFATDYFYWVLAYDSLGDGAESASAAGSRNLGSPDGLTATNGTSLTNIDLSWNAISNAINYDIYRNTSDDFGSASLLLNTASTSYSDTSASAGVVYFYWIVAKNNGDASSPGASDSGWRSLAAVTNLVVSMGEFAGLVSLSWDEVTDASTYRIYRSSTNVFGEAVLIGEGADLTFDDLTAGARTDYYYWVEASNGEVTGVNAATGALGNRAVIIPDLTIGSKPSQKKGNNRYNSSGSGQKIVEKTTGLSKVKNYSQVQNDALTADRIRLSGSKGNSFFKVKYRRRSPGSANITAAVKTGRYYTGEQAFGAHESIEIELKPAGKLKDKKKSYNLKLKAYAGTDSGKLDAVKVQLKRKP